VLGDLISHSEAKFAIEMPSDNRTIWPLRDAATTAQTVLDDLLKIRNHYVPRLYLKRWAQTDPKVFVYRLLG
jgi:hypothetical protein